MQTQEIPTHEWVPFLNQFSRRHQGESVTVEIISRDIGVQKEAEQLPLVGVGMDVTGDDREQVEVIVGDSPNANIMHAISHPSRIWLARTDAGDDQALQIESEDGPTTLVRLQ